MTRAQQGYAQARLQARFGARPSMIDFRLLDASRDAAHLREALRVGPLARFVSGLGPAPDADGLEARLRAAWRSLCAEVAGWHDREWRVAFGVFAACPDLAGLERLRAPGLAPAWVRTDPWLGLVARAQGADRAKAMRAGYGTLLSQAFASMTPLRRGWQQAWRASWPAVDSRLTRQLTDLARICAAPRAGDERANVERAAALERIFRRGSGTPATGFAYLGLVALALERIRGAHAALLLVETSSS